MPSGKITPLASTWWRVSVQPSLYAWYAVPSALLLPGAACTHREGAEQAEARRPLAFARGERQFRDVADEDPARATLRLWENPRGVVDVGQLHVASLHLRCLPRLSRLAPGGRIRGVLDGGKHHRRAAQWGREPILSSAPGVVAPACQSLRWRGAHVCDHALVRPPRRLKSSCLLRRTCWPPAAVVRPPRHERRLASAAYPSGHAGQCHSA